MPAPRFRAYRCDSGHWVCGVKIGRVPPSCQKTLGSADLWRPCRRRVTVLGGGAEVLESIWRLGGVPALEAYYQEAVAKMATPG